MRVSTIALLLLLVSTASSYMVANSNDALDVASMISYANIKGESFFYVTPSSDMVISARQIGDRGEITLVQSAGDPILVGLRERLEQNGNEVTVIESESPGQLNLELAGMSGAEGFILTDPNYGHNIAVLIPYAKTTRSYIIFATRDNAEDVAAFLSSNPAPVLVYGYMDGEVISAVEGTGLSYEEIDNEDKYLDNIELVRQYYSLNPREHNVLLADGMFLEESIDVGEQPVLLVSTIIPQSMQDFIKEQVESGQIGNAVLIGSLHVNPAYDLMKKINNELGEKKLTVMVKFGQAIPDLSKEVGSLKTFPLPSAYAAVTLDSASYNIASGMLELVFSNSGTALAFVQSNIKVLIGGELFATVGDDEPYTLRRGESKGVKYPLESIDEGQISINSTTYYGTTRNFDKGFIKYMDVGRIDYVDRSLMLLLSAEYVLSEDVLSVKAKNNGTEDVYYRLSSEYTSPEGTTTFYDEDVHMLEPGQVEVVRISGLLLEEEYAKETQMMVTAEYGGREAFLEKETSIEAEIDTGIDMLWLLLLLLLVLLMAAYIYRKKKGGEKKAGPKAKK